MTQLVHGPDGLAQAQKATDALFSGNVASLSPRFEPIDSTTDVMPLTHRAKYTMLVQSTVALALFGLIVARAVNAFT